jgi:hypothetical protein
MLYKIKDDYYVRVGRKYIKIDMVVKGDDVQLVPNNKHVIEENKDLVVKQVSFDDKFKKALIDSRKPRSAENEEEKHIGRRYR